MGGQSRLGRADQFCRLRRLRRIGLKTARGRSAQGRPARGADFSSGALPFRLGLAVGRLDWGRTGVLPVPVVYPASGPCNDPRSRVC